ncbi:MAG: MtrAB system histidine kinase MtrB [Nakamurella sp.]
MTAGPAPDGTAVGAAAADPPPAAGRAAGVWVRVRRDFNRVRARVAFWSRSLLVRVVVLTLTLSTIVMVTLGLILEQQITTGLLRSKIDAATAEIDSARQTVQASLSGADSDPSSLREQLKLALGEIGRADGSSDAQGSTAGVFEPVIVPSRIGSEADLAITQPTDDVPAELRARIGQGQIAYQYTTIVREGQQIPALVMGSPARTSTDSFEVYLIFPLAGELGTVQVVQRTLLVGGIALAVALTLISALVASQVVRPVRRAAASARKLAAGDLAERMPVSGPIELATLANSFNGMAEAIRVQIRQLEEFGKLQRRFTSDVSHELRTPLTTVRMAADILHDGREDFPPHLARSTELLVDELDRFESLLADLLEISRYDAGMAELSAEPIDIRSSIFTSIGAAGSIAAQLGVEVITLVPDEPVVAEIDTRRVDRILRNLLYNAIDHADGRPVEVELAADTDSLAITVTDHGVGLRPGEAGLVFNRFWRADPSRQRQTGGTGLGLAISLEDARLHGGWLQASGAPGEGARFRLTLPRQHGGLITQSPLPLRIGAEPVVAAPAGTAGAVAEPSHPEQIAGMRMMVEDGTLKPVPNDDELHPETVPSAGASAALSLTESTPDPVTGEPDQLLQSRPKPSVVGPGS